MSALTRRAFGVGLATSAVSGIALGSNSVIHGATPAWSFELARGPWGTIGYLETRTRDFAVGLIALPHEPIFAFTEGLLFEQRPSFWRVDHYHPHRLRGVTGDHLDAVTFRPLTGYLFSQLAMGATLTIHDEDSVVLALNLIGARQHFAALMTCQDSYA